MCDAPADAPADAAAGASADASAGASAGAPAGAQADVEACARADVRLTPFREIDWQTARLTVNGHTDVPAGTSGFVAFDRNGTAILTDASHISLYGPNSKSSSSSFSSASSPSHSLCNKIPLPEGVAMSCYKAITCTTIAVQQIKNNQTFLFRRSEDQLHQLITPHQPEGGLRGSLGDHLVYAKQRSTGDFILSIQGADGEVILEPPAGRSWSLALSLCRTPQYITVVNSKRKSMDVFSVTGEHISYTRLDYVPRDFSGITTCGPSHVIVAQSNPPALYIHHLPGGEMVRSISVEELWLGEDNYVWAVQYSEEQSIIHLATGPYHTRSLWTIKVE